MADGKSDHDEVPQPERATPTPSQMSIEELLELSVSFGIRTAARAVGIGQRHAYEMAAADTFACPVKRYGQQYRVTRPDLFRYLGSILP